MKVWLALIQFLVAVIFFTPAGCGPGTGERERYASNGATEIEDKDQVSLHPGNRTDQAQNERDALSGSGSAQTDPAGLTPDFSAEPLLQFFGQTMEQIRAEKGAPDDQELYEGSEYFYYAREQVTFFFWPESWDDESQVRAVSTARGTVAGVKIGMSVAQIKAILGPPLHEGYAEYDEMAYSVVFDTGKFTFFFEAESEKGRTTYVLIKYSRDTF